MPAKIYTICGCVGAGKSTLARKLVDEHKALLFTGDEWMSTLFFPDLTGEPEFDWIWERMGRNEKQMWRQVVQAAAQGIPSVLDLGMTTRDHRKKFADLAKEAGLPFELHWLDIPAETRWARTQKRNEGSAETYVFQVSRKGFDFVDGMWEEPTAEEMQNMNCIRHTA